MYKKHKKSFVSSVFLILIVAVSLGYAFLSRNLNISGSSKIKSTRWNIHFENVQVTSGSDSNYGKSYGINARGYRTVLLKNINIKSKGITSEKTFGVNVESTTTISIINNQSIIETIDSDDYIVYTLG